MKRNTFHDLGTLVGITLLNGGYGVPIFNAHVAEMIVFGGKRSAPHPDMIPDTETRGAVKQVILGLTMKGIRVF